MIKNQAADVNTTEPCGLHKPCWSEWGRGLWFPQRILSTHIRQVQNLGVLLLQLCIDIEALYLNKTTCTVILSGGNVFCP